MGQWTSTKPQEILYHEYNTRSILRGLSARLHYLQGESNEDNTVSP